MPGVNSLGGLDSSRAADTIFMTDPKYVFLNRAAVRPDAPRIVFVGASNSEVGFKQREVQPLLANAEVDSLCVGGSNMTQVAQVVDLVQELQDAAARRRTTFVIGIWYGMFTQDRTRWDTPDRHQGDTDIDIERYRYGFYRRGAEGPQPVLPADELQLGVALIHPYLVFDELSRRASATLRDRLFARPMTRTDAERNAAIVSEAGKEAAVKYWREHMHSTGSIADEQFLVLRDLMARILSRGSRVVLVDLPIPRWHEERSPFYPEYVRHRDSLLSGLEASPGFAFLEMTDQDRDDDFSDEVHPKPHVTAQWARRVAVLLHAMGSDAGSEPPMVSGVRVHAGAAFGADHP
jgi:hypothetical protein